VSARDRGWGPGWPTSRASDQVKVSRGGGTPVASWYHRGIAPLVVEGLRRTEEEFGYDVRMLGGYNSRPIRGSTTTASNHSWGLALDINWDKNPMTSRLITDMPGTVVHAWKDLGFGWGGNYGGRKDSMHYEYNGTPQDAARRIAALTGQPATAPPPPPPSNAPPFPGRILRLGVRGGDVRTWQHKMAARGWRRMAVDGVYGPLSKDLCQQFQREKGLTPDGEVGKLTWAATWR
jgi:hypothetical protein